MIPRTPTIDLQVFAYRIFINQYPFLNLRVKSRLHQLLPLANRSFFPRRLRLFSTSRNVKKCQSDLHSGNSIISCLVLGALLRCSFLSVNFNRLNPKELQRIVFKPATTMVPNVYRFSTQLQRCSYCSSIRYSLTILLNYSNPQLICRSIPFCGAFR